MSSASLDSHYRVLLVDEHVAVHRGVADMLAPDAALVLVAFATDGEAALELMATHRPDVVLLDHDVAGTSGFEMCLTLKERWRPARVLVYADSVDEELVTAALVAGADGVLGTAADAATLREALRATARGETWLPPLSTRAMRAAGSRLDPADLPIFAMLRDSTPAADIAATLRMSLRRLAVRRRAMLERLLAPPVPAG